MTIDPSLQPMLARLVRSLPRGPGLIYEPKWDGFRCLVFADDAGIDMRSRNRKPLARYFPEVVAALRSIRRSYVLDGEIVVPDRDGLDFSALLQRLHPASSRVELLSHETPARFIAFDLVALEGHSLCERPFTERRACLEELFVSVDERVEVTPATTDPEVAEAWLETTGRGSIDGVVVKDPDMPYLPGKRRMVKVKRERTADCVVAGFRWHYDQPAVGSLLLGLYDRGLLRHVGLAAAFRNDRRRELLDDVLPLVTELAGHPWERGFNLPGGPVGRLPGAASRWAESGAITWVPLRPQAVCEVAYEHFDEHRFRHPPRFRRWRPDRDPRSCTFEQLPRRSDAGSPVRG